MSHHTIIEKAWQDKSRLCDQQTQEAIIAMIDHLDQGKCRIAEYCSGKWVVNEAAKKAVMLYFSIRKMKVDEIGPLVFHDKIPLKKNYKAYGVRVVPPGVARYGAFLGKNVVLMPAYVNIGAYIDEGTMIDIGTVIGSGAQIGKNSHISAGTVIGGVLEPIQAMPVIIEDGAFVGAKVTIVEGVRIGKAAVIGAGVTLTASTHIIDVTQAGTSKKYQGYVPEKSVVIPGTFAKKFPGGVYQVPCALIIGQRKASTAAKTALNEALRS